MTARIDGTILHNLAVGDVDGVLDQLIALGGSHRAVFDNSTQPGSRLAIEMKCAERRIHLITDPRGNVGTAVGLNRLLSYANEQGCEWLHYLDQDSRIDSNYEAQLAAELAESSAIALGCSYHEPGRTGLLPSAPKLTRFLISSGTAFNVSKSLAVGGFAEQLFLDTVDTEFSLRARKYGYILQTSSMRSICHTIGAGASDVGRLTLTQHPEWRRIQMWRNTIFITKAYVVSQPTDIAKHVAVRLVETLLQALKTRSTASLRLAVKGIVQGLKGQFAPPKPPGAVEGHSISRDRSDNIQ